MCDSAAVIVWCPQEAECQNLKKVMRDLAITRAEAITLKVQLSESYNRLHQEYCR